MVLSTRTFFSPRPAKGGLTYPSPTASAAAQWPVNGSEVEPAPGENAVQLPGSVWINRLEPSGDQLKDCSDGASNSRRGKPDSLTIQTPAEAPPASAVANATQCRSGNGGPV